YHFILNLFLVNSWGLEKGPSFNGPNWSISVEVLLYLLFFILCAFRLNKKYIVWLLVFLGLVIQLLYSPIGRGMFSFFLGGCVYYYYLYIQKHNKAVSYLRFVSVITFVLVLLMILNAKYDWLTNYWSAYMIKHHYSFKSDFLIAKILNLCVRAFVLPSLLLFTVLLETVNGAIGKRLAFIGHISYSSYLIHFPLQMIVIYCAAQWGLASSFFNSSLALAGFFIVLITLSLMSYYYFELPVQNYLRKRLLKKAGQNKVTNG
ncbi:MAG: acyltransferase, partial [Sphingobacteriales bacterium]